MVLLDQGACDTLPVLGGDALPEHRVVVDIGAEFVRLAETAKAAGLGRQPVLAARRVYLSYFSDSTPLPLPWTDLEGLVRYLSLNGADLVFLEHRMLHEFPFLSEFKDGSPTAEFELLHSEWDSFGEKLDLYVFHQGNLTSPATSEKTP